MNATEWTRLDKSTWGDGAWQSEPDKVQWVDDTTGLDCLIVRNNGGALCGYVGLPESHPFHGKDYGQCSQNPPCEDSWCDHSPGSRVDVHGGLTFADSCNEPSREKWEKWRKAMFARRDEAAKFPRGGSARDWAAVGHLVDDFDGWHEYSVGRAICHIPLAGRPDKVWWLGFDTAHSGDFSPAFDNEFRTRFHERGDTYRTRAYVEGEVRQLAAQLAKLAA